MTEYGVYMIDFELNLILNLILIRYEVGFSDC